MKKILLFVSSLISMSSATALGQTLTPNAVPGVQVGTTANISFNYTAAASCAVYAELRIANINQSGVITQDYSAGSNYISGAFSSALPSGSSSSGTVAVTIPSNAVPSSSLPVGKTYSWVFKLTPGVNNYSEYGTTFQYTGATILASSNAVDTLVLNNPPVTIVAGTDVTISVNYTCPAARLIKFGISIYNASGFVSDLVGTGVDNLPATTTSPVTLSQILSIPANAVSSANLPAGQFYKVDTALFTPAYASYILGASSNVNLNNNLAVESFNRDLIKIYPNPASTVLNISDVTGVNDYEIYDIVGKVVLKSSKFISNTIDIATLNNGIYYLKINNLQTLKFIKN
jgi:Secretion system C-terminal sorting domain